MTGLAAPRQHLGHAVGDLPPHVGIHIVDEAHEQVECSVVTGAAQQLRDGPAHVFVGVDGESGDQAEHPRQLLLVGEDKQAERVDATPDDDVRVGGAQRRESLRPEGIRSGGC